MADKVGIERHIELLQKVNKAVVGVQSAPYDLDDYPVGEIAGSDMPMVLTMPEEGGWRQEGITLRRQDRRYNIRVFVGNVNDLFDGELFLVGVRLLQRLGNQYLLADTQELRATAPQITLKATNEQIMDTGFGDESIVFYADASYRGFEFSVGVYEKGV